MSSSTLKNFSTPMIALATYPIITPRISSVTFPLTFCEMNAISAITASAPTMAETVSAKFPK